MIKIDSFELKREQNKLARKIRLQDDFDKLKTIAGVDCIVEGDNILASVVVCEFPSLKVIEKKTYSLSSPLPYKAGFQAYREMPAIIEAYNQLDEEPDVIMVNGLGINHPRKLGMASHLGLSLNKPTIGVTQKLPFGTIEKGKIINHNEHVGFEVKTREHANPVYVAPGHLITFGSTLNIVSKTIQFPHKMPEPLHIARKVAKKKVKGKKE
ncbi:endonuclease V [Candidatus Woesearchaeota archaeon]|nr:endonuclease V [Candidatus Woesearchaeota archaeon]MBT4111380.1 endonuclease V [Candidatus Woesearchaeota archaeon]MBT4336441.1 endonuclease V [Candidatus Woesearchaeota archaeon]MBT4469854.1 endonuclease V [Candidatus Woesearchaeota archaeon]MBT6744475.1 endonuclease V [Candidatus Woesearchaeota archaeon]